MDGRANARTRIQHISHLDSTVHNGSFTNQNVAATTSLFETVVWIVAAALFAISVLVHVVVAADVPSRVVFDAIACWK